MSNNKQSMGDMQFNGTPDEWEALVKKNKMSNNKQSSVEWLYNKMYEHRGNITIEEFEQAKAMHKEEMCEFADEFAIECINFHHEKTMSPERFYELTFGGNNEQ